MKLYVRKQVYNKYFAYIDNCDLLQNVKNKLLGINAMDLRKITSFSVLEDLKIAISDSKMFK